MHVCVSSMFVPFGLVSVCDLKVSSHMPSISSSLAPSSAASWMSEREREQKDAEDAGDAEHA